jgi:3-isopropylmalate/(R)-2-methylmalate dehydratase small subunit
VSSPVADGVVTIAGRGIPLRGDDIDTDRIMPGRFLRVISFEGLEGHLFEDDRQADPQHPFNDPRYRGAVILVVNANFGCGSSREHAPQGLSRAGIRAIVGESFSEIFQGNAALLGIPCLSGDRSAVARLQEVIERAPDTVVSADVESGTVTAGSLSIDAVVPAALRDGFISGQWNPTGLLLARFNEVRNVAGRLPYLTGF